MVLLEAPEAARCRWRRSWCSCLAFSRLRVRWLGDDVDEGEAAVVDVVVVLFHGCGELEKCGVDPLLVLLQGL